ncbi:hypothetical protein BREVNS_1676 [Brevinematales bacterium NS]|nr:hypothetical protein BREVNS_1676 [Brevinematales bacterium NS]
MKKFLSLRITPYGHPGWDAHFSLTEKNLLETLARVLSCPF